MFALCFRNKSPIPREKNFRVNEHSLQQLNIWYPVLCDRYNRFLDLLECLLPRIPFFSLFSPLFLTAREFCQIYNDRTIRERDGKYSLAIFWLFNCLGEIDFCDKLFCSTYIYLFFNLDMDVICIFDTLLSRLK